MCTILLVVFTKAHIAAIPFCTLYCWDPGVHADFILICLKRRRAGDTKLWSKSCFLQDSLFPEQNTAGALTFRRCCQILLCRKTTEEILGAGEEIYTGKLFCWLITVPLYEEAIDDL